MMENLTKPKSLRIVTCFQPKSKSCDGQILDSIDTEADVEKEIFKSSEFEKSLSELIISTNMWLKSHDATSDVGWNCTLSCPKFRSSKL